MGGTPDEIKVYQNNIMHDIRPRILGAISGAISVFSIFLPVCWRYDIGYDIVENYDIVYDIVPDQAKYICWRYDVTFYHDISPDIVDFSRSISVYTPLLYGDLV